MSSGVTGVLASFHYYGKYDFTRLPDDVPLILDSGAFSAFTLGVEIKIEEYAAWALALGDRYDFAFNLDVLGDAEQSMRNWSWLQDAGVHTLPVIHYGTKPEDELPAYLAAGADHIAFGGIASAGATPQVAAWTAYTFRWLRDNAPHIKTHGLGVHMKSKMARFPWSTTDSASWTGAWRFGRCVLWDFRHRKWVAFDLDGRGAFKHGALIRAYGYEPAAVAVSTSATRLDVVRLVASSEARAALDHPGARYLADASPHNTQTTGEVVRRYLVEGAAVHLEVGATQL